MSSVTTAGEVNGGFWREIDTIVVLHKLMLFFLNFSLCRNDQKDMLASFGLAQDSNFPTAAFVAAKGDGDNRVFAFITR